VFFPGRLRMQSGRRIQEIDQAMPIVAETEQIVDRRDSCLKSRARFSDGSGIRFFRMLGKNLRWLISELSSLITIEWE
ncbi:MAG TPA: hypothetical protein VMU69_14230, partial [Bradyrhizobium sp.]|nr:hypothetical protein [Bradyrhizobium sp.]